MSCYTEELIDAVIEQIRADLAVEDTSAIYELLSLLEAKPLEHFLKEEDALALRERWNMDVPVDYLYEC